MERKRRSGAIEEKYNSGGRGVERDHFDFRLYTPIWRQIVVGPMIETVRHDVPVESFYHWCVTIVSAGAGSGGRSSQFCGSERYGWSFRRFCATLNTTGIAFFLYASRIEVPKDTLNLL